MRTSFGWVDLETWKQKQAKQARRKEAKRDQHPIYRTTKANYKWIFHDPTGQLQQRFNQQKERSHLRFLRSWMRSYPHGTLQSGIPAQQSKASNKNNQLPKLHVNDSSYLSSLGSLANLQFDGSPMSGALPDPYYQLRNLSKIDYRDVVTRNTSGKACSLPVFPVMDEPDTVQVWFIGGNNAEPERTGSPPFESEEELRGEVDPDEEVMRRDTEHRLVIGRRCREIALDIALDDANLLGPYAWPPSRNITGLQVRSQPYIEHLESRISLIEERIRGVFIYRVPRPTRPASDTDIQELGRVTGVRRPEARPPLPFIVCYAMTLQQYIADLETRINDFRADEENLPTHDTLDSLRIKLRKAKHRLDRLPPIHDLPLLVPSSRGRLQLHEIPRISNANVAAEPEPRPRILRGVGIIEDSPDIPAVQRSGTTRDSFSQLFQGHPTRHVSASTPTIIAPQTHREANPTVIEDLTADDNTNPGHVSEEGLEEGGNRTITEGTSTDGSSNPNPTQEDKVRPDTRNPIAVAPPPSPPHCDPDLEHADSVAQPSRLVRQCSPRANFSSSKRGRPDPTPDVGPQEVQMETAAAPIDGDDDGIGGPSSSAASGPNPQSRATRASTSTTLVSPDVDDCS